MPGRSKQFIWIFSLLLAVLVTLLGVWGNSRLQATIANELKAQLAATLNANVTALGIWTANQMRLATALAEDSELSKLSAGILQANPHSPDFTPLQENLFGEAFKPRLLQLGYENCQLVNHRFVIAASMRNPMVGRFQVSVSDAHTNKFAELFANHQPVIITPFKPELLIQKRTAGRQNLERMRTNIFSRLNRDSAAFPGKPRRGDETLMQVAAPVRNEAGSVVGALALVINPDKEFSRILSVAYLGDSGETYAFDQTGLMISRSLFDIQLKKLGLLAVTNSTSALNLRLHDPGGDLTQGYRKPAAEDLRQRPLMRLVADAVDGEDEILITPSRDYRGVPVVGAARWLPEYGFGVVTQMDAAEAYRPLRMLQYLFAIVVLLLLLCTMGLFTYANLTWGRHLDEAALKLKQLGQYRLEEKIGEGGMGVVYRARHSLMRRETAVKLLLPDRADRAAVARFEREVCLTCQLTHPNTIQVYDYGHTPEGVFYYAMEYLQGLNLQELVEHYGPQPETRVVYILAAICDSLAEAHAMGLIHRDIKPANIFLCRRGGVPDCVKVLDFGLVRDCRSEAVDVDSADPATSYEIEGTPWFTPPEAIHHAGQVDLRSDLYSMGALGYHLLTGQFIFDATTVDEVHEKQLHEAPIPPALRTTNPISPEMEKILFRCLEKDPDLRPQTAAELKSLLLSSRTAADWSMESRTAWWEIHEEQPVIPDESEDEPGSVKTWIPLGISMESRD